MKLYSTNNPNHVVSLREAVLASLPPDNGLYMPTKLPPLPDTFFSALPRFSFAELSFEVARHLLGDDIPGTELLQIVSEAINFPAPTVQLDEKTHVLELFHGPTLAFKDFGARFMARVMSYFNRHADRHLTILVATSGDTGGAVAAGFYKTPGIDVVILYPKGKVSGLQEKQLTTLGENITALEVSGSFDDCQRLVKRAFLDPDLRARMRLSSANSINIARLIPQSFYYFEAWKQVFDGIPPVFVTPSGNFGNITAGLLAQKLGLPVRRFVAANNANDVFKTYLETGDYKPRPSIPTISNAMDVGAPSNFARILALFGSTWNIVRQHMQAFAFDDEATKRAIETAFDRFKYVFDPHGAVGFLAREAYRRGSPADTAIILETAHPAKFLDVIPPRIARNVIIPERLASLRTKTKVATPISAHFDELKQFLLYR